MSEGKFKIIADGTMFGVKVFAPNGDDITAKICAYEIKHEAGNIPKISLTFYANSFEGEILADAENDSEDETISVKTSGEKDTQRNRFPMTPHQICKAVEDGIRKSKQ